MIKKIKKGLAGLLLVLAPINVSAEQPTYNPTTIREHVQLLSPYLEETNREAERSSNTLERFEDWTLLDTYQSPIDERMYNIEKDQSRLLSHFGSIAGASGENILERIDWVQDLERKWEDRYANVRFKLLDNFPDYFNQENTLLPESNNEQIELDFNISPYFTGLRGKLQTSNLPLETSAVVFATTDKEAGLIAQTPLTANSYLQLKSSFPDFTTPEGYFELRRTKEITDNIRWSIFTNYNTNSDLGTIGFSLIGRF